MLRLIIKGRPEDAVLSASIRNIGLARVDEHPSGTECLAYTDDFELRRVIAWFCEPGEAPFQPGSLLFYSEGRH